MMLENITWNVIKTLTYIIYHFIIKKYFRGEKMTEKEFRRSLAVFPIGTVMELTGLTARQIRYYEEFKLIHPERTSTNRRRYSLNDVDRLLEIGDLLADGTTLKGIQKRFMQAQRDEEEAKRQQLTDQDVRRILREEIENQGGF